MYNDTIKVANKIISDNDLVDIFQRMNEELQKNIKICKQEAAINERYEREYQNWTTRSFKGEFRCVFNFYDDTNISVDNYNEFITIFNTRLHEIKNLFVKYSYIYWIQHGSNEKLISQWINIDIYEDRMNISVDIKSDDNKMDDIYQLIKDKILSAPVRYDRIVKKKNIITSKIGFALGFIPSIIICTLFVMIPSIRQFYGNTYILYPIIVVILSLVIGNTVFNARLDRLYSTIVPDKKYAGYDTTNHKSIYKDDIDKYLETSEIIIGKNIDNIKNRKEIIKLEEKYSKYIPIEIIALLVLSVFIVLLSMIF